MQYNGKTSLSEALICSEFCAESQKFVMLHSPELSTQAVIVTLAIGKRICKNFYHGPVDADKFNLFSWVRGLKYT